MLKRKLQYRIVLLVFAILLVLGVTGGGMILFLQNRSAVVRFTESMVILAAALRDSLEHDMLQVNSQHIQKSVELMASRPPVSSITIFSLEKRVFASNDVNSIGRIVEDEDVSRVFASGDTVTRDENTPGGNIYVALPVLNKPDCYTCHGSSSVILGAIEIGVDRTALDKQLRDQTLIMVIIAGITFLFIGSALTYMFRSSVLTPLSRLTASAKRIAEGELDTRVEIQRDDEVGLMAKSFNDMAKQIEQDTRAMEANRLTLEETVQKRTKELQETAAIRGQLLERLISAQEEERRRVARELHDEAGQALSAIMLDLARAIDALPAGATEARQKLLQSRSLATQTLGELRKMIYDLRPEVLDHLGLAPALRSYVKARLEDKNIKVKLSLSGLETRLPPRLETTIFRVIQEATTNVVRHSSATNVYIRVAVTKSTADVSIDDDGKGFDVDAALRAPGSWGLRGIGERVSSTGGQLSMTSAPGHGTQIKIQIPLEG